jgi:hypothetical protein
MRILLMGGQWWLPCAAAGQWQQATHHHVRQWRRK